MASIKKYAAKTAKKGYLWRVQYRDAKGTSRTKSGFANKAQAEKWAAQNTVDLARGQWIAPENQKVTVAELWAPWIATKAHLTESSLHAMETSWRTYVKPEWGELPVSKVKKADVQTWVSAHANQASTIRRAHGVLAGIMDMAVEGRCVLENPARPISLPRKPEPKHVYLTMLQLSRLVAECSQRKELIMLLGTTGLRWGEGVGIRKMDLMPDSLRIHVRQAVRSVKRDLSLAPTKNHENRIIACPKMVMDSLVELSDGLDPADLIFTTDDRGLMPLLDKHSFFHMAVGRLVKGGVLPEKITAHGLRHVAAGLLVSGGANVKVVQRQLGHKSAAMTLDVYADLFHDDLDEVVSVMDREMRGVVELSWNKKKLQAI